MPTMDKTDGVDQGRNNMVQGWNNLQHGRNSTEQTQNYMEQGWNKTEQTQNNAEGGWNNTEPPKQQGVEQMNRTEQCKIMEEQKKMEQDKIERQNGMEQLNKDEHANKTKPWNSAEQWNKDEHTNKIERRNEHDQWNTTEQWTQDEHTNKIKPWNDTEQWNKDKHIHKTNAQNEHDQRNTMEQWNQTRDGRNSEEKDHSSHDTEEKPKKYTKGVTKEIINNNIKETEILLDSKTISPGASLEDEDSCSSVPEGGYGWCVVLAGTICAMVVTTQGPCFGVLYGARLDELGATPGLGSWLFNFQSLIWNLAGPWTGPLSEMFSYRQLGVFGALLVAASAFLSAIVTSPYLYFITFGIFVGIGGAISIMSCFYMVPQYFHHRLGLANGFMVAGGSLGIMTLPQFASYLQEQYPFQAAAFITGAVMLNVPVLLLLLHPVSWHNKLHQVTRYNKQQQQTTSTTLPPSTHSLTAQDKTPIRSLEKHKHLLLELPRGSSVPEELLKLKGGLPEEPLLYTPKRIRGDSECHYPPTNMIRPESECQHVSRRIRTRSECRHELKVPEMYSYKSSVLRRAESTLVGGSTLMGSIFALDQQKQVDSDSIKSLVAGVEEGTITKCTSRWVRVWQKFRGQYNLSLIKDPLAAGLALASCVTITASLNIFASIPFLLRESGYSLSDTATALSVSAVMDLLTRLLASPLTDLPGLDSRVIYAVGQLIFIIVPFVLINGIGCWWVVLGCMVMFGMGVGIIFVLDVLLVIKVLGRERLPSVFGLSQFFRCIFFAFLGPVGGELRKATGDFTVTIIFFSCVVSFGLALLLATALYQKCALRNTHIKARECDGSVG